MDKAHGDYESPFTCGSEARRAVIKYFVRDYAAPAGGLPGQCGTDDLDRTVQDKNKESLVNIVHARLTRLYEVSQSSHITSLGLK